MASSVSMRVRGRLRTGAVVIDVAVSAVRGGTRSAVAGCARIRALGIGSVRRPGGRHISGRSGATHNAADQSAHTPPSGPRARSRSIAASAHRRERRRGAPWEVQYRTTCVREHATSGHDATSIGAEAVADWNSKKCIERSARTTARHPSRTTRRSPRSMSSHAKRFPRSNEDLCRHWHRVGQTLVAGISIPSHLLTKGVRRLREPELNGPRLHGVTPGPLPERRLRGSRTVGSWSATQATTGPRSVRWVAITSRRPRHDRRV
jgi:hypothetical protein